MSGDGVTVRHAVGAGVTALTLALLGGCTATPTGDTATEFPEHIHSIEVASDDHVYVATHHGLFRLSLTGGATLPLEPVGTAFDVMGLAADGEALFASGHPATGGNLGLVRSVDGGETWELLPGTDGLDFHVLTVARGSIYGVAGSPAMTWVSDDEGASWSLTDPIAAADLLIDGTSLLATTADGLVRSDDGARSFALIPDSPLLYLIASDPGAERSLVGIDVDGALWVMDSVSGTWANVGSVLGRPDGLTVSDSGDIVVADERGISLTRDGQTWTTIWPRMQ